MKLKKEAFIKFRDDEQRPDEFQPIKFDENRFFLYCFFKSNFLKWCIRLYNFDDSSLLQEIEFLGLPELNLSQRMVLDSNMNLFYASRCSGTINCYNLYSKEHKYSQISDIRFSRLTLTSNEGLLLLDERSGEINCLEDNFDFHLKC